MYLRRWGFLYLTVTFLWSRVSQLGVTEAKEKVCVFSLLFLALRSENYLFEENSRTVCLYDLRIVVVSLRFVVVL